MHRKALLNALELYQPITDTDKKAKQAIQEFVKNNEDCFERSLSIGHITASSWLLNKDGTKVLLMYHAKLNRWVQLGGHCDGDADVLAVAIKEAQEESGIEHIEPVSYEIFDIDVHLIPANAKEPEHYHYDVRFLLHVTSDEDFIRNHESKDMRWFGKDKQGFPTKSPSVVRMLDKWIALKGMRL
ncbi:MAG: NUDIX hydrolase [Candidatus Dependentiae bacterium]